MGENTPDLPKMLSNSRKLKEWKGLILIPMVLLAQPCLAEDSDPNLTITQFSNDSTGVLGPYHRENGHQHKIHRHFQRLLQVFLGQYVCMQVAVGGNVQVLNNIVVSADVPRSSPC